jgi:hypothetical protein
MKYQPVYPRIKAAFRQRKTTKTPSNLLAVKGEDPGGRY